MILHQSRRFRNIKNFRKTKKRKNILSGIFVAGKAATEIREAFGLRRFPALSVCLMLL